MQTIKFAKLRAMGDPDNGQGGRWCGLNVSFRNYPRFPQHTIYATTRGAYVPGNSHSGLGTPSNE